MDFLNGLMGVGSAAATGNPVASANAIGGFLTSLLSSNTPNPDDWKGWNELDTKIGAPIGTNCINWIINDGDSVQNEAKNIASYIQNYGIENVVTYSSWFNRAITTQDVVDKLKRGGAIQEAAKVEQLSSSIFSPLSSLIPTNNTKGGSNTIIYIVIAAIILFVFKPFKRGNSK